MGIPATVYNHCRTLLTKLVDPLRAEESPSQFTLSIPEAQTTTVDSVQGWMNRPPAVLKCPGCEGLMYQDQAISTIDCTECYRDFREDQFSEYELVGMICPRCESEMKHGRRHPNAFDIPEWATCTNCQYHWDLAHWY